MGANGAGRVGDIGGAEEEAKVGGAQAALARTDERFGQAAELTGQLQASVPRSDSFGRLVEHLADFRPGESTLRRATRLAALMFLTFGASVLPAFLVQNRLLEWPSIPAATLLVFCYTFLNSWMRDALYGPAGRSWLRAVLIGGASSLLIPGVTFVLCLILTGKAGLSMVTVLPLFPWAVSLVWIPVAVAAYISEKRLRYRREWDSLPIG
jgi:hypothetical protein